MGEKISDVVLRFKTNGEVSYTKTIKSINREMNISATEYRNQVATMSKNATETEKLTATKKKLEKQLELAGKRSQLLREEYEKSVQETGRYSDQSQKLYKQLLDSESGEHSLKVSLEETNKELKKQGDLSLETAEKIQKIEKTGDKLQGMGKKMSIGVTAPIMAAQAASVKAYEDMRASQAKLINQTGKTGEEATKLKESLRNLYGNSAKDSGELADALGTVTQRFDVSGKAAEDMTTKFLTFARVNDVDAPNAIEKVSRAMGDAGIKTKDYEEVLDLLTVASKKSGIEVDKLAENLTKYGAPMRALGFDTKSAIAIFATWEKAGVNTEIAFSGMKKAIGSWAKEGKVPLDEFPKAMEKIQNSANPAADAIEVFGQKAGNDIGDAIKEGRFNVEDMTKALDDAKGKMDEIGNESGNPMSNLTKAYHRLSNAIAPFGEIIINMMIPAVQKFAEFMAKVNETLNGMDEGTRKVIIVLGGLAAAIGPTLIIIGSLASGLGKGVQAVTSFIGIWSKMTALLAANPFILVIAAIAALVAGLVWAYNNVEWFHDGVNAFFTGIKDVGVEVFNFLGGFIGGVFGGILANFQNFYDSGKRILSGFVDFITGVFTGNWSKAWQGVVDIFGGIFDGIVALGKAPLNNMIGLINGFLGGLNNIKIPNWVPGIGGKGFNISKIPYLATGGHLLNGQAIVGEAGPELLQAKNGKTTVTPLNENEKKKGITGKLEGGSVEQHIHIGTVNTNSMNEVDRLNRNIAKASKKSRFALGGA